MNNIQSLDYFITDATPVKALHLFTTSACNLNCEFCYLHKNEAYHALDKEIQAAWVNHEYPKTILKVLDRLDINPLEITGIYLWGGESFLRINEVTENLPDLFEIFPNIDYWLIPTNFTTNTNDLIDFISTLNKLTIKPFTLQMQLSIDGPEGIWREHGHQVSDKMYEKQIDALATFFNNSELKNIKQFRFAVKATVGSELYFSKLTDIVEMEKYAQWFEDFIAMLNSKIYHRNFRGLYAFPSIATPYKATVQDGINYNTVLRNWNYIKMNNFEQSDNLATMGEYYYSQTVFGKNYYINEPVLGCDMFAQALVISPDGTLNPCPGCFVEHRKDYQNLLKEEHNDNLLRAAKLVEKHGSFNPLTATDEDIKHYKWYIMQSWTEYQTIGLSIKEAGLTELALSGQVPWIYYSDPRVRMSAARIIATHCNCARENIHESGIPQISSVGGLRLLGNGAVEIVERDYSKPSHTILRYKKEHNL